MTTKPPADPSLPAKRSQDAHTADGGASATDVSVVTASNGTLRLASASAFLIGVMITIVLHEGAHAAAGLALGYQIHQYPFAVTFTPDQTVTASVITNLAGPLFSAVLGSILIFFQPFKALLPALIWKWFAFTCAMEGISYFCLTPLGVGDTGNVATLLNWPLWLSLILCAGGIAGIFWLSRRYAKTLVGMVDQPGQVQAVAFHAWVIGAVVAVGLACLWLALANLPLGAGDFIAVAMDNVSLGVYAPMAVPIALRSLGRAKALQPIRTLVPAYVAVGVGVVMNLLLTRGLTVG